ncbi:MAG TPA: MaoC family dehydratase [Spirochaetota bacterium]|nr:MaoC family dehydratase [Spirochaetota bacterium]OPZ34930.1 MAG: (R)-specific enoyl-CoA hydratase [Spirochaetes bacterium ADurb.BinA120]HNU92960.1 MaoC family dehydratase [Spirochaetota bacterium]HPV99235.1 MaoC family dehydratase [Spirochaetota bacterium]
MVDTIDATEAKWNELTGGYGAMSTWREQAIRGIRPGDVFVVKRTFTREDTEIFGDITRDYNPVHYDGRFAAGKGLKGLICHGLLVGGMICEIGGQIAWLASGMTFKFLKPVYFGDTITCTLMITDVDGKNRARAIAEYVNQDGEKVIEGSLTGRLSDGDDARILREMLKEGDETNPLRGKR